MPSLSRILWLSALGVSLAGCGDEPQESSSPVTGPARPVRDDENPPTALWKEVRQFEADLDLVRSMNVLGG